MQIVLVFMVAVFAIPVQCQTMTLRNLSSSYLTYEGLVIEPEGAVTLTLKTAQLNATVLYIQGVNDTFIYLHLVNGRMTLTLGDGDGTQTMSLPDPYNSDRFLRVRVVFTTDGMVEIIGDGGAPTVSLGTIEQFVIMSPIFIGGIPDPPPFDITHGQAVTNTHFAGCVRRVQLSNGTDTSAAATAANRSSDVVDECVRACDSLDCNPDSGGGECIEYYSRGVCDCRRIAVSEGTMCSHLANTITFNGSSYRCYSLSQYDSPFVEGETITIFIMDPSVPGTLMTGQQDEYQFSLSIRDQKLHYEALLGNQMIVRISTDNVSPGTFQVNRNITTVEINSQMMTLATGDIAIQEFGSVQFTDICVGGGSINNPTYSDTLQSVYYNLHYLSASGAVFEERTTVSRVNFANPNALIELPGDLADNRNIWLSFRTSQRDAMLLQAEDSNGYLNIFISNSQVHASLNASGTTVNRRCSLVNITNTTWYRLTVEPVVEGCDANCQLNIALSYIADAGATAIDQCNLPTSAITSLSSASVVIGGINVGRGMDGLMGCLELMVNFNSLNLEGVVDGNTIHTDNCGSCDIMPPPCLNGGMCVPLNDYEFNCSCVDPYFGDFCGMEPVMTSSMTSTTMATSFVMMTISTSTMTTTSSVAKSSSVSVMVTSYSEVETTSSKTSSVTISTTSSLQSSSTPTDQPSSSPTSSSTTGPVPTEGGGDDDDVGTLIGIVLGIIVLVLLMILVILIIIVVIRNRNNRRGFYPTNEGKGGEEMILKYSASLRSITRSGATSDGAENGGTINRVTKKEQEYYI